jgi:hypothetical protein
VNLEVAGGGSHYCIMAGSDDNGCPAGVTSFGFAQDRRCTQEFRAPLSRDAVGFDVGSLARSSGGWG